MEVKEVLNNEINIVKYYLEVLCKARIKNV